MPSLIRYVEARPGQFIQNKGWDVRKEEKDTYSTKEPIQLNVGDIVRVNWVWHEVTRILNRGKTLINVTPITPLQLETLDLTYDKTFGYLSHCWRKPV
jgi:hypothetical protein